MPSGPAESALYAPVQRVFPRRRYYQVQEAPLGNKRIDLLCVERKAGPEAAIIAIELKVKNWRQALWQAYIDLQIASEAYVGLWHESVDSAVSHESLFHESGVGLISVTHSKASIILPSADPIYRISRDSKRAFYEELARVNSK